MRGGLGLFMFQEPIVCGLDGPNNTPFIAAYDLIGAGVFADDFCVGGTCSESLYGMCESLYKPDLEADDLFEVISQALLSAINRDALSGWGAQVTIITAEGVTVKTLKARQD
jgi:20S proteasome subunit beta 3